MTAIGLGDIAAFPFIDPPDRRNVTDGVNLLHELGALDPAEADPAKRLTPLGRRLAQLPVDPRLARMVVEGERNGCATEVMVIAAALSIQDPRERPAEKQAQADQAHARFADTESDFVALPQPVAATCASSSGSCPPARSAGCARPNTSTTCGSASGRTSSASCARCCVPRQDGRPARDGRRRRRRGGADLPEEIDTPKVHQSLLPGLLSHIGLKDAAEARVPGRAGREVRALPRLGAVQEAAALGDGRRAGGDLPAVGPGRRPGRAGVGRAAGPAPGQAQLQRAALGEEAGAR